MWNLSIKQEMGLNFEPDQAGDVRFKQEIGKSQRHV